ncbi:VIT family-domain-containing protein [Pseudomassariella vexata]|uniref:VIT family-domain-containing protein n=1 Tax=Pseudomassariella vexata TaxID=1141098 RepID=A0A1Y2DIX0_9PEZI|nr:VIT family-domain-containing protein [Pseudomassariella vexata]ORY59160.1 VIT family-domain-containing protein [Pseudomassariella vexata]
MDLLNALRPQSLAGSSRFPAYATLPTVPTTPTAASHSNLSDIDEADSDATPVATGSQFRLPTLSRFLADFTLGFADGLTVPFALTAGLSSLGQTETVIYAGMAEICAGSISMGIGGYLAAKGEMPTNKCGSDASAGTQEEDADPEKAVDSERDEAVENYLAPLALPEDVLEAVRAHVLGRPSIAHSLQAVSIEREGGPEGKGFSPVLVGLSVSIGYLLGGLLPLSPYFFVSQVGDGLLWSFLVCILALFAFGFCKHYLLQDDGAGGNWPKRKSHSPRWRRVRRSLWEGTQMVILGSIAAVAAVLCVRIFEAMKS